MTIGKSDRRVMSVLMDISFLQEMMEEGYSTKGKTIVCEKGLPPGAICAGAFFDFATYTTHLLFEHPVFDPVPRRARVPQLEVIHHVQHDEGGRND